MLIHYINRFVSLLRPCILPIVALNVLKCDIVKLQSEQYAYTTEQEQLLIKVNFVNI